MGVMLTGLLGAMAQAATYTLPNGTLPAGCTVVSSTSVTCPSLKLDWADNVVVSNANLTLTVTNTFTVGGNNNINISSPVSGFSIQAKTITGSNTVYLRGNLTTTSGLTLTSSSNNITGNVNVGGTTKIGGVITGTVTGAGSLTTEWATTITGDVNATTITSGGKSSYGGHITASTGDFISGSGDKVTGNVSAVAGKVTLKSSGTTVGGSVTAKNDVIVEGGNTVSGSITSTQGGVTLGSSARVGGGISAKKSVTLDHASIVTGNVSSEDAVTLQSTGSKVIGDVIAKKKVKVGNACVVTGSIQTDDEVDLQSSSSQVDGNVVAKKTVTLAHRARVKGDVSSGISDVELKDSDGVVDGCVSVDAGQTIKLSWNATVGGVCCQSGLSCTSACVVNNSGRAMPALCTAASAVLLADYRFDECAQYTGAAGEVKDQLAAFDATPLGGLQNAATGVVGRLADFSAPASHLQRSGGPLLRDWSVATWFKLPFADSTLHPSRYFALGAVSGGGDLMVLDRNNSYRWMVYSRDASDPSGDGGTTHGSFKFNTLSDGWHHLVVVGRGNTTALYVDGVYKDQVNRKVEGALEFMGASYDEAGTVDGQSFGTALDEFKVFSNVLTPSEISAGYANELAQKNWDGSNRAAVNCSGAACVVDDFATGALNPALWNSAAVSGSFTPAVVDVGGHNRIRLTQAAGNQSTMLQLRKWFPGAGNKIVVDFDYHVYGGSGADGATVVFSDAAVTPAPGGFGGSLGYAQRSGIHGFAGGWLAIGMDEFGNFPSASEGRTGYPSGWTPPPGANVAAGQRKNNVSVRGSGSGPSGYALLANTGTLSPVLWNSSSTSASLQRFRITIDHSNNINAYVTVERDATGSGSYVTVVPTFDAKAAPGQSAVPTNWLVSFTGSTGGSHNYHEIANLSICATNITDPGGGVIASNFECMDGSLAETSYANRQVTPGGRNPIYTKLARTAFKLRVVPIRADGAIEMAAPYENTQVEVFDVSTGTEPACSALATGNRLAGPVAINFLRSTDSLTVNKAVTKARCRVTYTDPTSGSVTQGCASDLFAVRPGAVTLSPTLATATGPAATAMPLVKAGANFTLRATTSTSSSDAYSGTLTQNSAAMTAQDTASDSTKANGGVVGALTPSSMVANASAVNATYAEVGYLYLAAGAYRDTTFTAIDASADCVAGSTSVVLSGNKYGCVVGNTAEVRLGRFVPDHFDVTVAGHGEMQTTCGGHFTYIGQPMTYKTAPSLTIKAMNGLTSPGVTRNYSGVFQKLNAAGVAITAPVADAMQFGKDGATKVALTATLGIGTLPGFTDSPPVFTNGTMTYTLKTAASPVASNTDRFTYTRDANAQVAPFASAIWLPVASVSDSDAVVGSVLPTIKPGGVALHFGRLRLQNAFGSERLPLTVPVQAQHWNGSSFAVNTEDSCTPLAVPAAQTLTMGDTPNGQPALYFYPAVAGKNQLLSADTVPTLASPLVAGQTNMLFSAPMQPGWLDLILEAPDYLQYNWGNCNGQTGADSAHLTNSPCARITFGIYRSGPIIYRRENY